MHCLKERQHCHAALLVFWHLRTHATRLKPLLCCMHCSVTTTDIEASAWQVGSGVWQSGVQLVNCCRYQPFKQVSLG